MRVLVVDDSAFMRRAVHTMLNSEPGIEVVAIARNGKEGLELAQKLKPDVITLDIEMPEMDGLTALRRIMRECPTNVIMVSSLTTEGSVASLQALRLGAADVIAKDQSQVSLTITNMRDELIHKVKAIGVRKHRAPHAPASTPQATSTFSLTGKTFDMILIGSSTGGPPVLETIFTSLPQGFTTPVVVAQHMPELFTKSMAQRLDEVSVLHVQHGENRMPIQRGCAYIAPGGLHTHIRKTRLAQWHLEVGTQPASALYRPSANALFESAAQSVGSRCLAIVLTGIGDDGCNGARELHAKHAAVLAQSEETCVVYGMPKAVTQAGITQASLSPEQLGQALAGLARSAAA